MDSKIDIKKYAVSKEGCVVDAEEEINLDDYNNFSNDGDCLEREENVVVTNRRLQVKQYLCGNWVVVIDAELSDDADISNTIEQFTTELYNSTKFFIVTEDTNVGQIMFVEQGPIRVEIV